MAQAFPGGAQRTAGPVKVLMGEVLRTPAAHCTDLDERCPLEPSRLDAEPHGGRGDVEVLEEPGVAPGHHPAEQRRWATT